MYFSILFDIEFLKFYYLPNFIPNWYICAFSIVAFVAFVWSNHIPPPHLPKGKKYLYFSIGKYFSNLKMSFRCVLIHQFPLLFSIQKKNSFSIMSISSTVNILCQNTYHISNLKSIINIHGHWVTPPLPRGFCLGSEQ